MKKELSRRAFNWMGVITLVGFGGAGIAVIEFLLPTTTMKLIAGKYPVLWQIGAGAVYGGVVSAIAVYIIRRDFMQPVREYFGRLVGAIHLKVIDIIFISFCAGVGEEIFFRGALQPYLGIWLTSLVFVLLHRYLDPRNWRISVYGVYLLIAVAGFGYLKTEIGLTAAIVAHFVVDVVLFIQLKNIAGETEDVADNNENTITS